MDKYGTQDDPYLYKNSQVLKNKLRILSEHELNSVEYELTELAILQIEFKLPPYDFTYWCSLHKQLFQDLYSWAGKIRTIDISKGNTRFCNTNRIRIEAQKVFEKLKEEDYLIYCKRRELIIKLAKYFSDLNVIHPFREGNGRSQRLLFEHIIIHCGYKISFHPITIEQWQQANIAAYFGDSHLMEIIFERCISD